MNRKTYRKILNDYSHAVPVGQWTAMTGHHLFNLFKKVCPIWNPCAFNDFIDETQDFVIDRFLHEKTLKAGSYQYVYDPDHKHKPEGDWEQTEKGWSQKDGKPSEKKPQTQSNRISFKVPLSAKEKGFVSKHLKTSSHSEYLKQVNSAACIRESIEDSMGKPNHTIDRLIDDFTGAGYANETGKMLSILAAHSFGHLTPDYRTGFDTSFDNFKKPTPEALEAFKKYREREVEVLKHAGFVTPKGTIRLFRNSASTAQLKGAEVKEDYTAEDYEKLMGHEFKYSGNHSESWSLNPNLDWEGVKITAEVPAEAVIASFVGRKGNKCETFAYQDDEDECEVIICADLVDKVACVSYDGKKETDFVSDFHQTWQKQQKAFLESVDN